MYDVPSDYTVEKVIITPATVNEGALPEIVHNPDRKPVQIKLTNNQMQKSHGRKDTAS